MTDYMTFHYRLSDQDYVEAYPTHGQPVSWLFEELTQERSVISVAWMSSPSRNQARRAAYTNWVRADGVGFNQLPYREYADPAREERLRVHRENE